MNPHDDLTHFLASRRAKLDLQQAGLPDFGGRRRVPGLRREEVALLAGISSEYYKRLERGNVKGVSDSVVEGISRALQLDAAEDSHLRALIRSATTGTRPPRRRPAPQPSVDPVLQQTIDAMSTVPVFVQNGRLDAVATNRLGRALFSDMFTGTHAPVNAARFVFLDAKAHAFYRDWDANAGQVVALLRAEAGRSPYDRQLHELVEELSARSDAFHDLWSAHDVREHRTGLKEVRHPKVGDLDLSYLAVDLTSEPGLQMLLFSAAPGSATEVRIGELADLVGLRTAQRT